MNRFTLLLSPVLLWLLASMSAADEPRRTTLIGHKQSVHAIAFSPDSKLLASVSGDKTAKLWDVATGKDLATLEGHENSVVSAAFSPDGKTLATGSWDSTIKLWDVESRKLLRTLDQTSGKAVAFSPDGKTLASGSMVLWDVETGKKKSGLTGNAVALAYSAKGKFLASCEDYRFDTRRPEVKLWDTETNKERVTIKPHEGFVVSISPSPDGKLLATCGGKPHEIKIWDAATGRELQTISFKGLERAAIFSPDGKSLATVRWLLLPSMKTKTAIVLLNPKTGEEQMALEEDRWSITSLAFSPDGKKLAVGGHDSRISLHDVPALK